MKIANSIVFILFLTLGFSPVYANPAGDWLKSTEQLEGDRPHTINEIKSFLQSAEPIIEAGSDNPIFWYVLGIYGKRLFGDYYRQAKRLENYSPNNPEAQALVKQYSFYYRKSLDANDKPDAPVHLGVDELMSIASNILISPDIKERGYKKAIKLMQASDSFPDGYEYTTYQFLLESYSAQKNPDKYLATLNEMIDKFGSTEELDGYKRHVEAVIAQQRQTAAQDAHVQADTYTAPKDAAVQEPVKVVEPKVTHEAPASDNNRMMLWWLLGGGGALLFGLVALLLRRKQS